MKQQQKLAVLIVITCLLSIQVHGQTEALKTYYETTLKKNQIVGSSLVLLKRGQIIWSDFYGKANMQQDRPMDAKAIYHWASISKTFTGIAIMQLRDRGLLNLEDLAVKHLPEIKKIYDPNRWLEKITIRTLLNHSSGLRGATWPWKSKAWHPHEPQEWEQLVAMFPYTEILFEPGSRWSYSNPGIILLGRIIEEITQEDFEYYVEKNVLRPLGMLDSYYDFAPPHLIDRVCQSYWLENDQYRPALFNLNTGITVSNGGLMAPFGDMVQYLNFLMGYMHQSKADVVLKRSSLLEMFGETIQIEGQNPIDVDHQGMGLCFFIEHIYGSKMIGHSGFQNGFHTHLYFNLDSGYAYLIGYNSAGDTNRAMDDEIKRYLFKNIFTK